MIVRYSARDARKVQSRSDIAEMILDFSLMGAALIGLALMGLGLGIALMHMGVVP